MNKLDSQSKQDSGDRSSPGPAGNGRSPVEIAPGFILRIKNPEGKLVDTLVSKILINGK